MAQSRARFGSSPLSIEPTGLAGELTPRYAVVSSGAAAASARDIAYEPLPVKESPRDVRTELASIGLDELRDRIIRGPSPFPSRSGIPPRKSGSQPSAAGACIAR